MGPLRHFRARSAPYVAEAQRDRRLYEDIPRAEK